MDAVLVKPNKNTTVYSYPSGNASISIAKIIVSGRHPAGDGEHFIEEKCHVLFFILKGAGKVIVEGKRLDVKAEDAITINAGQKYYVEGNLEYLAATSPAYSPKQNRIVKQL